MSESDGDPAQLDSQDTVMAAAAANVTTAPVGSPQAAAERPTQQPVSVSPVQAANGNPDHLGIWENASIEVLKAELEGEMEKLEALRNRVFGLEAGVLPLPAAKFRMKSYARLLGEIDEVARSIESALRRRLREAGIRDQQVSHNLAEFSQVKADIEQYLMELAHWAAEVGSQSNSAGTSSQQLESTPTSAPPRPSDDGVRFLYSFMHVNSLARDGSGQWIRDSTRSSQQNPAPHTPNSASELAQRQPQTAAGRDEDPNARIPTRHPICFSGVTEDSSSRAAAPTTAPPAKTEQTAQRQPAADVVSADIVSATAQSPRVSDAGRSMSEHISLGPKARQVPKFNGDSRKFREWQQLFGVFVDETSAPIIEKFNVLRSTLTGEARDAIAHLQWEESHYQLAKEILVERFGDPKLAQRTHIKELDSLLGKGAVPFSRLAHFSGTLSVNVRALTALGVSFAELSTVTAPRVLNCLPPELRLEFLKERSRSDSAQSNSSELEHLITFLEATVKLRRESGLDERTLQRSRTSGFPESQLRNPRNSSHTSNRVNHSFFAAGQQTRPSKTLQATAGPSQSGSKSPRQHGPRPVSTQSQSRAAALPVLPPTVPFKGKPFSTATQHSLPRTETQHRAGKSCIFCEGAHESWRCSRVLSHEERLEKIQEQNGCATCLKRNHSSRNCRDGPKSGCPKCNGRHYLIMCKRAPADAANFHISSLTATEVSANESDSEVLLQMAVVWLESNGRRCLARVLLDTGAHRSYIASAAVKQIESAPLSAIRTSVKTMGNAISSLDTWLHKVTLRSRHDAAEAITIECIETPIISDTVFPEVSDGLGLSPIADGLRGDDLPKSLSIIVGAVDLAPIHTGSERVFGRMLATSSIFGWLFSGTLNESSSSINTSALLSETRAALPMTAESEVDFPSNFSPSLTTRDFCKPGKKADEELAADLRFLWEGEFLGFNMPNSGEEEKDKLTEDLDAFFDATTVRLPEGAYQLCLPFKDNLVAIGDNEKLARSRLRSLLVKLRKKDGHLLAADQEIAKSIQAGYAERARPRRHGEIAHYLPLTVVFKYNTEDSTIKKTRVCKDASAHTAHRPSLNRCLHQGSSLLPLIPSVLCAFRGCLFPVTADIQNAFRRFHLHPNNKSLLRFLWPFGISTDPCASAQDRHNSQQNSQIDGSSTRRVRSTKSYRHEKTGEVRWFRKHRARSKFNRRRRIDLSAQTTKTPHFPQALRPSRLPPESVQL